LSKRPLADAGAAILLFALNAWIAARLVALVQTPHFNSVEGLFIGLARYMSRHFGHFSWWPIWHCGMPYEDTYVPPVHLAVALTAMWTGASVAHVLAAHDGQHGPAHPERAKKVHVDSDTQSRLNVAATHAAPLQAPERDPYEREARSRLGRFEEELSYDNAKLAHALIVSGHATGQSAVLQRGLDALRWLTELQTSEKGHFRPIGSNGFYRLRHWGSRHWTRLVV
jgi:hypothetical protein